MRGGKRPGAGRKAGAEWATKRPPSLRALARERVAEVLNTETDPLTVLCTIAADPANDLPIRVQAASAVLPYIRPRLSAAVVANVPSDTPNAKAAVERLMRQLSPRRWSLMQPRT